MRIDAINQYTYKNEPVKKVIFDKKETKQDLQQKVDDKDHNGSKTKSKKKIIRYLLEGDIIKVYSYENDKKTCIKTIPVANATPDELAKVENLSFKEMLEIIKKQRSAKVI